jgi:hypothetical protein
MIPTNGDTTIVSEPLLPPSRLYTMCTDRAKLLEEIELSDYSDDEELLPDDRHPLDEAEAESDQEETKQDITRKRDRKMMNKRMSRVMTFNIFTHSCFSTPIWSVGAVPS